MVSLADDECPHAKHLIILVELERPFFDDMSASEWTKVQHLLKNANSALWITNGGLLRGGKPRYAMINGMACGIRTEMTRLRLSTVDLDQETDFSSLETKGRILEFADRCSVPAGYGQDMEFRIMKGVPYFSRLISDTELNTAQGVDTVDSVPFQDLSATGWDMSIGSTGIPQSLFFKEADVPAISDENIGMIEIDIKALGLSHEVRPEHWVAMLMTDLLLECGRTSWQISVLHFQ